MNDVLFVHNNFPGQFAFIAEALKAQGVRCAAIASPTGRGIPGTPLVQWQPTRGSANGHPSR